MRSLCLFRLKVLEPPQRTIFSVGQPREAFVETLLLQRPSEEIRQGHVWHIGNVKKVDDRGLVFAVGRTTRKSTELFDEQSGNFIEIEGEESPFTYVYYDKAFSIIGIVPKAKLAPTAKGIARSIQRLLTRHSLALDQGVEVEVSEIWDPETFLEQVRTAYELVGFTVQFTKPNPFDVEKDFYGPMERFVGELGGAKGRANVQGIDLNKEGIEEITRSVASTGNNASARLRRRKGQRPVTRRLQGDPVTVPLAGDEHEEDASTIFALIRDTYRNIRRHKDE